MLVPMRANDQSAATASSYFCQLSVASKTHRADGSDYVPESGTVGKSHGSSHTVHNHYDMMRSSHVGVHLAVVPFPPLPLTQRAGRRPNQVDSRS